MLTIFDRLRREPVKSGTPMNKFSSLLVNISDGIVGIKGDGCMDD